MAWFKGHWVTLFLVLMLIVGLCMLLYPSFSNYWNNIHQSRVIMTYSESVSQLTEEEFKQHYCQINGLRAGYIHN